MSELKFVVTGTAGVGKTTAITSISDVPPISTDAEITDDLSRFKETTTVAFDFGEIILDDDTRVRIYGTPGQDRFRHMWEILSEGALGIIILVDSSRPNPIADLAMYMESFKTLIDETGAVIGVTRVSKTDPCELDRHYEFIKKKASTAPSWLSTPAAVKIWWRQWIS